MTQHYVTFLSPGSFMPNERSIKISNRQEKFDVPKNCFGYFFWDREEQEVDGEVLCGKEKNRSGRYYFGKEMTVKEVEATVPNSDILVSNMRSNNWPVVVKTRCGNFQPLLDDDVIIAAQ